jgi:antitoxin ParD1/3/4
MNVSLGNKWERFVEEKVKSGDYQSASEVLREGLRLMEERELLKRLSVSSLRELEAKLLESAEKPDRGEGLDSEASLPDCDSGERRGAAMAKFILAPDAEVELLPLPTILQKTTQKLQIGSLRQPTELPIKRHSPP